MWDIYRKVMIIAFIWGAGTAFGELPPYFFARAGARVELFAYSTTASLAGQKDTEYSEFEQLQLKPPATLTWSERCQLALFELLRKYRFFGILLCASVCGARTKFSHFQIPNPLFDLAGITCGHFLIPFSTFFGATFAGKALVKAGIQVHFPHSHENSKLLLDSRRGL